MVDATAKVSAVTGGAAGALGHMALQISIKICILAGVVILAGLVLHRRQARSDFGKPGLYGVLGRMGGGKTYLMVYAAWHARRKGREVYANFDLEGAHRVNNWSEILSAPDRALVLVDEAQLWWPASSWRAPIEIVAWMTQIRKRRQTVLVATQRWDSMSRVIRELCFGVWECKPFRGGSQYSLYPPHLAGSKRDKRPYELRMVLKRDKKIAATYDTLEVVGHSVEWSGGELGYAVSELEGRSSGL